jgi:hypothetical protein
MVRCCHKLCQGWVAENGIVWQRNVGDVEVEAFCPVVVPGAKGYGQAYLPNWRCRPFGYPEEWSSWHEPVVRHLHLLEDLDRDDVEARPSVDESAIDSDMTDGWRAQEGNCPPRRSRSCTLTTSLGGCRRWAMPPRSLAIAA